AGRDGSSRVIQSFESLCCRRLAKPSGFWRDSPLPKFEGPFHHLRRGLGTASFARPGEGHNRGRSGTMAKPSVALAIPELLEEATRSWRWTLRVAQLELQSCGILLLANQRVSLFIEFASPGDLAVVEARGLQDQLRLKQKSV